MKKYDVIIIGAGAAGLAAAGIASAMMGLMERDVKNNGGKKIFLEVAENNAPTRALYANNGYNEIGRRPKYYDGDDAILMEKKL